MGNVLSVSRGSILVMTVKNSIFLRLEEVYTVLGRFRLNKG
jgi:hypothetical protein